MPHGALFLMVSFLGMPLTLTDADASLLLSHLLRGNPDSALLPIIQDLQLSLAASRSGTPFSTSSSGTLAEDWTSGAGFRDFLGCEGISDGSDVEGDYQSSEGLQPYCGDSEGWSENEFDVGPLNNTDYLSDGLTDYLSDGLSDYLLDGPSGANFGVDPSLVFKELINAVRLPQPSYPHITHFMLIGYREMVIAWVRTWMRRMMTITQRHRGQETASL
jgi:hypothetical protein